jgi:hypothetical protein
MAAVILFEMRLAAGSASVGVGGLSRAARARLAGAMFSMIGIIAYMPLVATHSKRHAFQMAVC